jgi:hypothetical protein
LFRKIKLKDLQVARVIVYFKISVKHLKKIICWLVSLFYGLSTPYLFNFISYYFFINSVFLNENDGLLNRAKIMEMIDDF